MGQRALVFTQSTTVFFKLCQKYYLPRFILINILFISTGGLKITDECGDISRVVSEAGVIIRTWCTMQ